MSVVALLPLIVTAVTAIATLVLASHYRRHAVVAVTTAFGLAIALATLPLAPSAGPEAAGPLLVVDPYAAFYVGLILASGLVVTMLAFGYLGARSDGDFGAFYVLLLLATLGAALLVASAHLASFFLALELLSVSLYGLIASTREGERPVEAAAKYLILAGASSAFLLFGLALTYAEAGTMTFAGIRAASPPGTADDVVLRAGLALMLTGIGFKLALVPFHMWTSDVYEGAPAPVSAFIATVSKSAMFALLLRYFVEAGADAYGGARAALTAIAIASMFAGNLLALRQDNVKRMLAYSSIAHLGYLVVALLASGPLAREAVAYYLVTYVVTMLGAFGVVTALSTPADEADTLEHYRGLFWHRPALACVFAGMLLSLAGIPLTAGFVGKFLVLSAGIGSALWLLVLVLVANSAIGLFYYLRIVVALFAAPRLEASVETFTGPSAASAQAALVLLTLLLICFGTVPAPLFRLVQISVADMPVTDVHAGVARDGDHPRAADIRRAKRQSPWVVE